MNVTDDRAHLLRTAVSMQQEFVVSNEVEETEARAHAMQELEVERASSGWLRRTACPLPVGGHCRAAHSHAGPGGHGRVPGRGGW